MNSDYFRLKPKSNGLIAVTMRNVCKLFARLIRICKTVPVAMMRFTIIHFRYWTQCVIDTGFCEMKSQQVAVDRWCHEDIMIAITV